MDIICQQFTKEYIANEMLDLLGYRKSVYGKKILENSCGEGNILCLVVERYIQNAYEEGYSRGFLSGISFIFLFFQEGYHFMILKKKLFKTFLFELLVMAF